MSKQCEYRKSLLCPEKEECVKCQVYADTMPIPWDIEQKSNTCEMCNHTGADVIEQPTYDADLNRDTSKFLCADIETCLDRRGYYPRARTLNGIPQCIRANCNGQLVAGEEGYVCLNCSRPYSKDGDMIKVSVASGIDTHRADRLNSKYDKGIKIPVIYGRKF